MAFTGRLGTDNSQLGNIELGLVDSGTSSSFVFTAAAVLQKTAAVTFTADSALSKTLVEDNFNRTTSSGDVGQPQVGHYNNYITDNFGVYDSRIDGSVNGTYLDAPLLGENWFKFGPSSSRALVTFDFKVGDINDGVLYEIDLGVTPSSTPPYMWIPELFVEDIGGGAWEIRADGVSYNFSPTAGDWWTVKAYLDYHSTGSIRIKTWKVGDPEPDWQAFSVDPDNDFFIYNPVAIVDNFIYMSSGSTSTAAIDNLRIQEISTVDYQDWVLADAIISSTIGPSTFSADAVLSSAANIFTISADAVLRAFDGTYQWGFTADAVIIPTTKTFQFTANAWITILSEAVFTANAKLVITTSNTFSADAWIRGVLGMTFTANAVLLRQTFEDDVTATRLRKVVNVHVAQRRPVALSAFIPPREPDSKEQSPSGPPDVPDLPCLPPCPEYTLVNGATIRRTIIYCDSCDTWYFTDDNWMGRGTSATSVHDFCGGSHSRVNHTAKIFADYSSMPLTDVGMKSKLVWDGNATQTVNIKVYANVPFPPLMEVGEYQAYTDFWNSTYWTGGDYIGTLAFYATGGIDAGAEGLFYFCDVPQSLTVRPASLSTDTFRFELTNLSEYIGAEFRAPNVPIKIIE